MPSLPDRIAEYERKYNSNDEWLLAGADAAALCPDLLAAYRAERCLTCTRCHLPLPANRAKPGTSGPVCLDPSVCTENLAGVDWERNDAARARIAAQWKAERDALAAELAALKGQAE